MVRFVWMHTLGHDMHYLHYYPTIHCFSTVLQVEVQVAAMMMRVLIGEIR